MNRERRRTHRFLFEAPIELTHVPSHSRITAVTGDIGRFGCFVRTGLSFSVGSTVKLRITENGRTFSATGSVTYVIKNQGMGITFDELSAQNRTVLEQWIAEQSTEPILLRK